MCQCPSGAIGNGFLKDKGGDECGESCSLFNVECDSSTFSISLNDQCQGVSQKCLFELALTCIKLQIKNRQIYSLKFLSTFRNIVPKYDPYFFKDFGPKRKILKK